MSIIIRNFFHITLIRIDGKQFDKAEALPYSGCIDSVSGTKPAKEEAWTKFF
jgi:hypothetical protein